MSHHEISEQDRIVLGIIEATQQDGKKKEFG
jgi:hypothetical protein